jgi:hypothetical protein
MAADLSQYEALGLNLRKSATLPFLGLNEIKISPHSRRALVRFNQRVTGSRWGTQGAKKCHETRVGMLPDCSIVASQ